MPREGVPYPGSVICSIKCKLKEIWNALQGKLHSINGVGGDGQGNVSIISADPAIVINNDAVHNQIEIDLDTSALPAAAVSSVNGQTGAVVLDAGDIGTSGGSDVQTDLTALATELATGVVHTSGDETVQGVKTFLSNVYTEIGIKSTRTGAGQNIGGLHFIDGNGATQAYITGAVNGRIIFDLGNSTVKAVQIPQHRAYDPANTGDVATIATLDAYTPMVRTTGNQLIGGIKQFQTNISRGCTSANVIAAPSTAISATIVTLVDQMNGTSHNTLGSVSKVRNAQGQNYIDILNTSYGYYDEETQKRIDAFLRILIDENTGGVQLILYRQKRNIDGTGTLTASKVISSIAYTE